MRPQWRWWLVLCALAAVTPAGCQVVASGFPRLDRIPAVAPGAPADQVRAFRVDVEADLPPDSGSSPDCRYTLRELPASPEVPAQSRLGWHSFHQTFALQSIPLAGNISNQTLAVRLYRPGFKTVEVTTDSTRDPIEWQPAATPQEQEDAVRALHYGGTTVSPAGRRNPTLPEGLPARASASKAHRAALDFIVGEYDRLIEACPDTEDGRSRRERLTDCARKAREGTGW